MLTYVMCWFGKKKNNDDYVLLFNDFHISYRENAFLVSIATIVPVGVHLVFNSDNVALINNHGISYKSILPGLYPDNGRYLIEAEFPVGLPLIVKESEGFDCGGRWLGADQLLIVRHAQQLYCKQSILIS